MIISTKPSPYYSHPASAGQTAASTNGQGHTMYWSNEHSQQVMFAPQTQGYGGSHISSVSACQLPDGPPELALLKQQLQEANAEAAKYRAEAASASSSLKQLTGSQAELVELRADVEQLRSELQQRRRAAQQHGAVTSGLEQQLAASQQEAQGLKQQVQNLTFALEEARSTSSHTQPHEHALGNSSTATAQKGGTTTLASEPQTAQQQQQQQQELDHLRHEVHGLRSELSRMRVTHRELSVQLASQQDELALRARELNRLRNALDEEQAKTARLQQAQPASIDTTLAIDASMGAPWPFPKQNSDQRLLSIGLAVMNSGRSGSPRLDRPPLAPQPSSALTPFPSSGGAADVHADRRVLLLAKAERALVEERRVSEGLRRQLQSLQASAQQGAQGLTRLAQLEDQLKAQQSSSNCKASSSASSADNPGAAAIAAVAAAGAPVLAQELQQIRQACMELASMPANDASAAMEQVPVTAGGISQQQQQAVDDLMLELRRLKQDNEALTAHVARCMSRDDQLEISLRAAHDRARVAESQSLDLTKQCEQAAATLGRLIDSNTELMNKINAQSLALAEVQREAGRMEQQLRLLQQAPAAAASSHAPGSMPSSTSHRRSRSSGASHSGSPARPPTGLASSSAAAAVSSTAGGALGGGDGAAWASWPGSVASPQSGPHSHPLLLLPAGGCTAEMHAGEVPAGPGSDVLVSWASDALPGGLSELDWKLLALTDECKALHAQVAQALTQRSSLAAHLHISPPEQRLMLLEAASHLAALEEQHSPTDHATISASDPRVSRSNSSGDSRSSTAGLVPAAPAQGHGQLQQSHVHAHTQSDLLEDSELSALGAQLGTHEDPALACLGVAGTSGGHAGPGPAGLAIGLALSLGDAAAEGAQAARVAWLARSLAQLEERLAVEVRLCARLRERAACAVSIYDPADDQASKGNKWNAMTQDVLDANQQQGQPGSSSEMHSRPPLPRVSALGHQHAVGQQASSGQHAGQVSTFDALQHQIDQQPVHEQEPSMQHTAPAQYIPEDKGAGAAQESHPQHEQLVIVLQPQQAVQQPLPQPPLTPQQHLAQQQQLAEQQQQLAQQLTADTSGLSVQPLPPAATSPPQQHSLQAPNAAPRVLAPFQARPAARTAALSVSAASQEAEEAATGTAKAAAPSQPQGVAVPPVLTASTDPRVTSTFTSGSQPAGAITPHAALGPADASVLHAHAHALGAREGQQPDIQRADPAHNASVAHSPDQLGHSNQMDAGMAPASGGGAGRVLRVAGDVGEALDLDLSVEEVEAAQRRAGRRGWGWLGRR